MNRDEHRASRPPLLRVRRASSLLTPAAVHRRVEKDERAARDREQPKLTRWLDIEPTSEKK